MSDVENSPTQSAGKPSLKNLRVWPVVLLLICMWCLKTLPTVVDITSMNVMMAVFMGPLAGSVLIVIWWLFLSRSSLWEKALGTAGLFAILAAAMALADPSIRGFLMIMFSVPVGLTGFAVALTLLSRMKTSLRTWVALLIAVLCFGYWDLIRLDEVRGDFNTARSWRWEPSAEDLFLRELAARETSPAADDVADVDPLADPEWPDFRGPNRDGVQPGVVLSEDWTAHPPQEIWRMRIGPGWSSFAVAGNRLFTQEQRGENEAVVCYDAGDGSQIWANDYESRFFESVGGVGPRGTPTLSDGKLFALGANGILLRLDPLTGEQVWQQDIRDEADRTPPTWGFSSSPLVVDGAVLVHAGGEDDKGMLAYDVESGEFLWGVPAGDHSYSSPQLSNVCGKRCVLMLSNKGLAIVDQEQGKLLGNHEWEYEGYRVIQPLVLGENSVLLGTAMGTGTQRIELSLAEEQFSSKTVWTSRRMNPGYNDFVAHNGYLYGFDNNIFACMDLATGDRMWKKGRYGNGQVVLLPDGDQLLVISEDGELVLLRTSPDDLEELARHQVLDGRTWNHPVLVGNRVYVRNGAEAACYELTTKDAPEPSTEVEGEAT